MNCLTTKFLLVLLVLFLLISGYLFFSQYKLADRIAALEAQISTFKEVQGRKIKSIEFQEISGKVTKIEDSRLTVLADILPLIIDVSDPTPPSIIEKTYLVNISKTTIFKSVSAADLTKIISLKEAPELKIGDFVSVSATEDIQDKTEFTAEEIVVFRE